MSVNDLANERTPSTQNSIPSTRHSHLPNLRNISSSHFRHLFKKHVGLSPTHYVKLLRIRAAKKLLRTTFLSVKEVMAAVGENDFSHFVRHYKCECGETPSETRALAMRRGVRRSMPTRNIGQ